LSKKNTLAGLRLAFIKLRLRQFVALLPNDYPQGKSADKITRHSRTAFSTAAYLLTHHSNTHSGAHATTGRGQNFCTFPVIDQHGRLRKGVPLVFWTTFLRFRHGRYLAGEPKTPRQIIAYTKKLEPRCGMGARQRGSGHGHYLYCGSLV
jgi:hypothetical protein